MTDVPNLVSRRGLLAGAVAASAVTLAATTAAPAAAAGPYAGRGPVDMIVTDRIAGASVRTPTGQVTRLRLSVDFHEELGRWLAFWSANSPRGWSAPAQILATAGADGSSLTLAGIRYQRDDQLHDGFAATRDDRTWWATLASLHHHFGLVRPVEGGLRVTDSPAGYTGSAEQVSFAVAACREIWAAPTATADDWQGHADQALRTTGHRHAVASRSGWAAFTRTTLRLGLGAESY